MTLTASYCLELTSRSLLIADYLRCFKPLLVALLRTLPKLGVFVQPMQILDCVSPAMLSTAWKPSEINRLVPCGD